MPLENRISEERNTKLKFLLAYEGRRTEKKYFNGINNNKSYLNIDKLIEIKNFDKTDPDLSNPLKILKELKLYVEKEIKANRLTKNDKIGLIVDRDPDSFSEEQYQEILDTCDGKQYSLYITNPNFELWLLLHFLQEQIDDNTINDIMNNKSLIEQKLVTELKKNKNYPLEANKFNKRIQFQHYKEYVAQAIKNAKMYETNYKQLKDSFGTNVHLLIEQMQDIL